MDIRERFYRTRLFLLMYGFAWVIRFAGIINRDFRGRLKEAPFAFVMKAADDGPARYFQCLDGKLRTGRRPIPCPVLTPPLKDFGLIWRDSRSGGQAMIGMLRGRPKALYNAVAEGVLMLEGEGRMVAWFLQTINQLSHVFRSAKRSSDKKKKSTNN